MPRPLLQDGFPPWPWLPCTAPLYLSCWLCSLTTSGSGDSSNITPAGSPPPRVYISGVASHAASLVEFFMCHHFSFSQHFPEPSPPSLVPLKPDLAPPPCIFTQVYVNACAAHFAYPLPRECSPGFQAFASSDSAHGFQRDLGTDVFSWGGLQRGGLLVTKAHTPSVIEHGARSIIRDHGTPPPAIENGLHLSPLGVDQHVPNCLHHLSLCMGQEKSLVKKTDGLEKVPGSWMPSSSNG